MSAGNKHTHNDMQHIRLGGWTGDSKPGVFKGIKFVKKANMWVQYECHNDTKRPDKFEWSKDQPQDAS